MCDSNEVQEQYPPDFLDNLNYNEIARETQAFLFLSGRDKVVIRGNNELAIVQARSLIEHKYDLYKKRIRGNVAAGDLQKVVKGNNIKDVVSDYIIVPPRDTLQPDERAVPSDKDSQPVINVNFPVRNPPSFPDNADVDSNLSSTSTTHRESDRELRSRDPCPNRLPKSVDTLHLQDSPLPKDNVKQFVEESWKDDNVQILGRLSENDNPGIDLKDGAQISDSVDSDVISEIRRQQSIDRTVPLEYEKPRMTLNDASTLEIMQKLGYDRALVEQIMLQLGPNASENDILGCLVSQGKNSTASEVRRDSNRIPDVDGQERRVKDISDSSGPAPPDNDDDNLRTIIIDGSNVAMR